MMETQTLFTEQERNLAGCEFNNAFQCVDNENSSGSDLIKPNLNGTLYLAITAGVNVATFIE